MRHSVDAVAQIELDQIGHADADLSFDEAGEDFTGEGLIPD